MQGAEQMGQLGQQAFNIGQAIQQQQAQQQRAARQAYLAEQAEVLKQYIPEIADPEKGERLKAGRCSAREQPRSDAHGRGIFPPGPADRKTWGKVAPSSQPALCRMADGLAFGLDKSRRDRLRACGNGVVPLQAAVAYAELLERLKA